MSKPICLLLHLMLIFFYFAFKSLNFLYDCVASDVKIGDVLANFLSSVLPRHAQSLTIAGVARRQAQESIVAG